MEKVGEQLGKSWKKVGKKLGKSWKIVEKNEEEKIEQVEEKLGKN